MRKNVGAEKKKKECDYMDKKKKQSTNAQSATVMNAIKDILAKARSTHYRDNVSPEAASDAAKTVSNYSRLQDKFSTLGQTAMKDRGIDRKDDAEKEPQLPIATDSDTIYFASVADKLSGRFGTKVQIKRKGKKGKVEIDFYSDSDLERLLSFLQE